MKKTPLDPITRLDPVIHSRIRLAILSILASLKEASFVYLKDTIGTTDGNLSANITKLEEMGYISIEKAFIGRKPHTSCSITQEGRKAFSAYLKTLEEILHFKPE
jgi:DNA-binding MarR family transcriptional regulator